MISQERKAELYELFWMEGEDYWAQEWRGELPAEEAELVCEWDNDFTIGMRRIVRELKELSSQR